MDLQDLPPKREALKGEFNVAAHGPARAARAGDPQEPTRAMGRAVAAALELPEAWFLEEDFDAWISRGSEPQADGSEIEAQLDSLRLEVLGEISRAHSDLVRRLPRRGLGEGGLGGEDSG